MAKFLLLLIIGLAGLTAVADDIEIPEEELARETTLPVFEKRRAVLNRNVLTAEHFELGGGVGLEMNEPYYSDVMGEVMGTYNINETSAINVQALMWTPGLSSYGEQLKAGGKYPVFDSSKAPHPQWGVFGDYEFVAYYGKISVTKQLVMNLNLFGLAGLGYINMGPVGVPALNLGVGQNFFFTKNFGLRMDLRWLIFQGPDATSQCLPDTATARCPNVNPAASSFSNRIFYNSQIGVAGVFIL